MVDLLKIQSLFSFVHSYRSYFHHSNNAKAILIVNGDHCFEYVVLCVKSICRFGKLSCIFLILNWP